MPVVKGFTLIEMLISLLITSLVTIMMSNLSSASLSVFVKSHIIESHMSDINGLLFSLRQEISKAELASGEGSQIIYIEANKQGIENSCIRFGYEDDGEFKKAGFRLDSDTHKIERYYPHESNWSCSAGYWQDLHDNRFYIASLDFIYDEPALLLKVEARDTLMGTTENFYVSTYVSK